MPTRKYECRNNGCERFGKSVSVKAKEVGHFFEWPDLRCVCGMQPRIVTTDEGVVWGPQA